MTTQQPKTPSLALEERIEWHITKARTELPNSPERRQEELMVGLLAEKYKGLTGKPYVAKYQEGGHS